ncbi:hypothetical protein DI487_08040 [Flavobacterium sediminis]|uniref:DUF4844 domain-containing protein n=1 Tax=Flavobacterium sediminis TaxID=2201181 RepID=A0A2U8QUH8_9FLAO|nr:DUF4844 domain-containing protein [Flavobacterium sediminis]AWM13818.1 hypothetical protein DI487_08040 [Flavobacterium sediminis]
MQEKLNKIVRLEALKSEPKFISNDFYTGLSCKENEEELIKELNNTIDTFIENTQDKNISEQEYQKLISECLTMFNKYNLDTEDKEYIANFFEKIMDAIELETSGGALNEWLYGFKF